MTRTADEPARGQGGRSSSPLLNFALVLLLATAAVGLFGVGRLWRQFPAAGASPALLVPFLKPVLALALEAGALVAFSAAVLRACASLPLEPRRRRLRTLLPLLLALLTVLALAEALPRGTEHPGSFANELVESARASCGDGGVVPVPLLGLSVKCEEGRIVGPMPGVSAVQLAMTSLTFSDDLRRVQIEGLELSARRKLNVKLRAGTARISGLSPWARSAQLPALLRFSVLAAGALGLGIGASLVWGPSAAGGRPSRPGAGVLVASVSALPGALAALIMIALDQDQARPLAYLLITVGAVAALGALAALRPRLTKMFSAFERF